MANKTKYISSLLLLLLIAVQVCRLSANFMCSCDEELHHHDHDCNVHICCTCPDHTIDCRYHDKKISDHSCHFHFDTDVFFAEQAAFDSRLSHINDLDITTLAILFNVIYNMDLSPEKVDISISNVYNFSISEWSSAPYCRRGPPVLV